MGEKYLVINTKILPEAYEKVVQVKQLLRMGKVKDITEAVRFVGISRSTYYKYKDFIFTMSESINNHKVTLSVLLTHEPGALSAILDKLAETHGNILTINQDIPINNVANITITFDAVNLNMELNELIEELKNIDNVVKIELIAME